MKTPAIEAFAEVAARFCELWSSDSEQGRPSLLEVARVLADLNRRALDLPDIGPDDDGDDDLLDAADAQPGTIHVPDFDLYWDIFDPLTATPDEAVANSLADDLGDIYSDLKRGLALFERGRVVAAVWEWRFLFWSHWGEHLVGAQRAIHLHLRRGE